MTEQEKKRLQAKLIREIVIEIAVLEAMEKAGIGSNECRRVEAHHDS